MDGQLLKVQIVQGHIQPAKL